MTPVETVHAFIELATSAQLDEAVALCAEDVEYDNVPMGKNIGRQAVRDFLSPMTDGLTVEFITHRETVTGNTVMNERTDRFTKGDASADIAVMGVWEVNDDGLITLWRDYFDMGQAAAVFALFG